MTDLSKLLAPVPDKTEKLDMCRCSNCDWSGKVEGLEVEAEGSWEEGYFDVPVCPVCDDGGCIDDYWYSDALLNQIQQEKDNRMVQLETGESDGKTSQNSTDAKVETLPDT